MANRKNRAKRDQSFRIWIIMGLLLALLLAACQPVRSVLQMQVEDTAAATQASEGSINTDPGEAEAYYNQGVALLESGDYDQAITYLNRAIELNPDYAEAYLGRGVANWKSVEFEDNYGAITQIKQDLDKAIRLDPSLAEAYYHRGLTYTLMIGAFFMYVPVFMDQAIEDFEMHLELAPDGPYREDALDLIEFTNSVDLAETRQFVEQRIEETIIEATSAIELDPNDPYAYWARAMPYTSVGKNELAIEDFRTFFEVGGASLTLTQEQRESLERFEILIEEDFDPFSILMLAPGIFE